MGPSLVRNSTFVILGLLLLGLGAARFSTPKNGRQAESRIGQERGVLDVRSEDWRFDRPFESMEGPSSVTPNLQLSQDPLDADRTFWLKGIEIEAESLRSNPRAEEYFCHANLAFENGPETHNQSFPEERHLDFRLFTLIEGRLSLHLPSGFGIPVKGGTKFALDTMGHNLNYSENDPPEDIRLHTRLDFTTKDLENGKPLKPLFRRSLYIFDRKLYTRLTGNKYPELAKPLLGGEFCGPSSTVVQGKRLERSVRVDAEGLPTVHKNPILWRVPPGRHLYEIEIQDQLDLPFDTKAHYIAGHLHTYSEWLRLVDVETGDIVAEISGSSYPGRRGMQSISDVVSQTGIDLHKGRRYKLQALYNNPTEQPVDAMAIMYIYLLDEAPLTAGAGNSANALAQAK